MVRTGLILSLLLFAVACDGKTDKCVLAGGAYDYELKECACWEGNKAKVCDRFAEKPAPEDETQD